MLTVGKYIDYEAQEAVSADRQVLRRGKAAGRVTLKSRKSLKGFDLRLKSNLKVTMFAVGNTNEPIGYSP